MTNFEKYKDEILKIVREAHAHPALKNGVPVRCGNMPSCNSCEIAEGDCCASFLEWLYEDDGEQELTCSSCKHFTENYNEGACASCRRVYEDNFEPKPKKTRQSEFMKLFPNAMVTNGVLVTLPCKLEGMEFEERNCNLHGYCRKCREDYWLKEVGE